MDRTPLQAWIELELTKDGGSVNAIAERFDVLPSAVSQYRHGHRVPPRRRLGRISVVTGLAVEELLREPVARPTRAQRLAAAST